MFVECCGGAALLLVNGAALVIGCIVGASVTGEPVVVGVDVDCGAELAPAGKHRSPDPPAKHEHTAVPLDALTAQLTLLSTSGP